MRLLLLTALAFCMSCNNASDPGETNKDTTTTNTTQQATTNIQLAATKWQLTAADTMAEHSLDQFEKDIVTTMKKDLGKFSLSVINDSILIWNPDADTSTYQVQNDMLITKSKRNGNPDTFAIHQPAADSMLIKYNKGIQMQFKKVDN